MVGVVKGAELGILIRSGEVLERVERLTTVVFDKTGTLTRGKPVLTQVIPLGPVTREQLLQRAASLEHGSEHPLAGAVLNAAAEQGLGLLPVTQFEAQVGEGVQAVVAGQTLWLGNRRLANRMVPQLSEAVQHPLKQLEATVNTVMLLGQGETVLALLAAADTLRPEARQAVELLKRRQPHHARGDRCPGGHPRGDCRGAPRRQGQHDPGPAAGRPGGGDGGRWRQ